MSNSIIDQATRDYNSAKARGDRNGMTAAHNRAERERAKSGFSGGTDGSQHIPISSSSGSSYSRGGGGGGGGGSSSSRYPTLVYNPDGSREMGYIENNLSYYKNGNRIVDGASVYDKQGRYWTKGKKEDDPINQYRQYPDNPYYDEMDHLNDAYAELQRQQEEAKRLAIQQGVNRLESNRGTINQGYDDTARQAYIQKMQSQQALPQQLAVQGIQGGGTESAQLALDTSYGDNINTNERTRQNALTSLDHAITDLRNTGDVSIADSNLALQQQKMQDYQNLLAQKVQQDNFLKQFSMGQQAQQQAKERQDFDSTIGAYSDDYQAEINRLLAAGYSEDSYEVKSLRAARNQKLANQAAAEEAARQQALENQMAWGKYQYDVNKPYPLRRR